MGRAQNAVVEQTKRRDRSRYEKSASRDFGGFQQRGVNLAAVVNSAPKAVLEGRDAGLNLEGQGRRHLLFPLGSLLRAATQP
jgi:hypothetical protein